MKKWLLPVVLTAAMLCVIALPMKAAPETVFLIKEDAAISGIPASEMPFMQNGEMYISYGYIDGVDGLKVFRNSALEQVMIYDFERRITFDLRNGITFDDNGVLLDRDAIVKNGNVFVPVGLLADKFGFYYSLITNYNLGTVVRICSSRPVNSDQTVIANNSARLKVIYNQYNAVSTTGTVTKTTSGKTTTTVPSGSFSTSVSATTTVTTLPFKEPANISLMLHGSKSGLGTALDVLDKNEVKAFVFFTPEEIGEYPELVIRAFCEGHSIGISLSRYSCLEDAGAGNAALMKLIRSGSVFVTVDGGIASAPVGSAAALYEHGYIVIEADFEFEGSDGVNAGVQALQMLRDAEGKLILCFDADAHMSVKYLLSQLPEHVSVTGSAEWIY